MPKQTLGLGVAANDNTGDTLRLGGKKINDNFDEIYNALGSDGTNITFDASSMDLDSLADVDTTGVAVDQYLQYNGAQWVPVTHEVDGRVTGHLVPDANVTWDLGSSTHRFRDLYLSNNSLHLGNLVISSGPNGIEQKNVLGVYDCITNPHLMGNGVYANSVSVTAVGTLPDVVNPFSDMTERSFPGLDINTRNPVQPLEGVKFTLSYVTANGEAKTFSTLKSDHDYSSNPPKDTNKFAEDLMSFGSYGTLTVYNREPLVDGVAEEIANASQVVLTITKEFVPAEPEVPEEVLEESDVVVDTSDINLFSYSETPIGTANGNWHFDPLGSYETSDVAGVSKEHLPGLDTSLFTDADDAATNFIDNYPGFQPGIEAQVKITKPTGEVVTYGPIPDHQKTDPGISGFRITGYTTIMLVGDAATDYSTGTNFAFEIKQVATDNIITGSLIPDNDVVYDLGSPSKRFRDLYISGSSIHFGTQKISDENGQIKFSAPLAPFEENTEVYFTTDKFVSTHPRQLTFNDDLPGVIVDVLNMKTTIEPEYDINLKINVAQGPTTLHNEIDVVADRLLSATSEAVIASHDEIEFVKQPGNRINGVVEANLRNPEHRYIGLRKGYYATLKVKLSDGPNRLVAEIDSMNHFRPEEHYQFQNSSDPEISIVQFTHGWPSELDGLSHNDNDYWDLHQLYQPCLYIRRPSTGEVIEVPKRSGFKDNNDREIYSGGDFFTEGLDTANNRTGNFWVYNQLLKSDGSKVDGKQYSDYLKEVRAENNNGTWVDNDGVTRPAVWVEYYKISQSEEVLVNVYHPLTKDKPVEHSDYFQFTSKNRIKLIKGTRSDGKALDFVKKAYEDRSKELSLLLTINRQERVEYNLTPAGSVYDATKSVSANYPDQVGSNTFVVVNSRCLTLLNPDIYNNYKQGYLARRPHLWFDPKKASLELSITKSDPTKKGDVLTAEGEQNLENKTLGKEGSPTYIDGHFIPTQNIAYDLGSPENRFRDLYLSADSFHLGTTKLSTSGGSLSVSDTIYNDKLHVEMTSHNPSTTQYDGAAQKMVHFHPNNPGTNPVPLFEAFEHIQNRSEYILKDGYSAKLKAYIREPIQVAKEYPSLETNAELLNPTNPFYSYITDGSGHDWVDHQVYQMDFDQTEWAYSDYQNDLEIHFVETELSNAGDPLKWKVIYKFTMHYPNSTSEKISEYYVERDDVTSFPKWYATQTSRLFNLNMTALYNVSLKYTKADGSGSDKPFELIMDARSDVNYIQNEGQVPNYTYPLAIVKDTDANSTPFYGASLALADMYISQKEMMSNNQWKLSMPITGSLTPFYPQISAFNPKKVVVMLEQGGGSNHQGSIDECYLRFYALESASGQLPRTVAQEIESYNIAIGGVLSEERAESARMAIPEFLTEFAIEDYSSQTAKLVSNRWTRPIHSDAMSWAQVLEFGTYGPTMWGSDATLTLDSGHQVQAGNTIQLDWHDAMYEFMTNKYGYVNVSIPPNAPAGPITNTVVMRLPSALFTMTAKNKSQSSALTVERLVSDQQFQTANNFLWYTCPQAENITIPKYPYQKPIDGKYGIRFNDNYEFQVRLYDTQDHVDNDKPNKIYRQLPTDYYHFEMTGALEHQPKDYNMEGVVINSIGGLIFKARDQHVIQNDFSRAIAIRLCLVAKSGVRVFENFTTDFAAAIADGKPVLNFQENQALYQSSTGPQSIDTIKLWALNAANVSADCDVATIVSKANGLELEISKQVVDPAVSSVTSTLANTTNQLNATIANTANQLSNSISTAQNLANSTAQTVTGIQNELIKALKIQSGMSVPTSNTAPGTMGDMVIDGDTVYIAVANNKWGRLTLDFNF